MIKILVIFLLLLPLNAQAEMLCAGNVNKGELAIVERDLNLVQAQLAVIRLKKSFHEEGTNNFEKLLSQNNAILIIEGTLLKQNTLLLKHKYLSSKKKIDKERYEKALIKFCEFKGSKSYVD